MADRDLVFQDCSSRVFLSASLLLVLAAGCSAPEQPGHFLGDVPDAGSGGAHAGGGSGTATGGARVTPGSGGAAACVPALASCGEGDTCCGGAACIAGKDGRSRCARTCKDRLECGSLCCAMDEATGLQVCADESACPPLECSGPRGPCEQPGPSCCDGLTCVFSRAPEYSGCRKPCEVPGDCDTGCCVPYANSAASFCADAAACACSGADEPCGGVRRCCDGLTCTSFDDSGAFACKPRCEKHGDCATTCCHPVAQTTESACLPRDWCD